MHKVAVLINSYDDPNGIIKILTEPMTYDYIHTFYIIEGKYKGRQDEPEFNMDLLLSLKKEFRKVHLVINDNLLQIEKRNKYWDFAEQNMFDYAIVCDTDEYLKIDPDKFENSLRIIDDRPEKCYPVVQNQQFIFSMARPRLFKAPFTFRHRPNKFGNGISHGSLYEDYGKSDTEVINQMYAWYKDHPKRTNGENQDGVRGIQMWHDKDFRSKERIIADRVYYDTVPDR